MGRKYQIAAAPPAPASRPNIRAKSQRRRSDTNGAKGVGDDDSTVGGTDFTSTISAFLSDGAGSVPLASFGDAGTIVCESLPRLTGYIALFSDGMAITLPFTSRPG